MKYITSPTPLPTSMAGQSSEEGMNIMNNSDIAYIIFCTIFVFFMTPGLAIFYGGLVRRKNVIGIMEQSFISIGIVSLLWAICGFSIAYGGDVSGIIGNTSFLFMKGVGVFAHNSITPNIPLVLFFVFQLAFAIITPALISGAIAERASFKAYCLFIAFWMVLVYAPIAHWVWGGGFLAEMGLMDFAGGLVIHLSAGISSLAAVLIVGAREKRDYTPCNMMYVAVGTGILWAGWFAFNGGSALAANGTAALAVCNTLLASAAGSLSWLLFSYADSKRVTLLDTLMGGVAGLIIITPMAGFVQPFYSLPAGLLGGFVCNMAVRIRSNLHIDDTLDVFSLHGVGGACGVILTGVFADPALAPKGGAIYGNAAQLTVQALGVLSVLAYSVLATIIILKFISIFVPLRLTLNEENRGLDESIHGELLYYKNKK